MPGRVGIEALGDIAGEELAEALRRASAWVAAYLDGVGDLPVMSRSAPGDIRDLIAPAPPDEGEPLARILDDFERVVVPGITHWNHPRFFAYFGITGSAPGILAELLCAALNVNAMLWRASPAATEVEEVACDWLRQAIGLDAGLKGHINDTASTSTFYALGAAREAIRSFRVREEGVDGTRLRLYTSAEAHSSVDKAGIALGTGLRGVVKIPVDARLRMDPERLRDAIRADRRAGLVPFAVVATVGTTSTTSIDPVPEIAEIAREEGLWLHVDAAYGGAAGVQPSHRHDLAGCELADSLVVNPHKWLFTPIDCSVLYLRDEDALRRAFSLVPDYLRTDEDGVRNLMDYGTALGRRFRGLKLWFVLRAFGLEGVRARIAAHVEMARALRGWIEEDPDFEVVAPTPFSTVVFRLRAGDLRTRAVMDGVNASGHAFLSHTSVGGDLAMRMAIGNIRTTLEDVRSTWELIRRLAGEAAPS